MQTIVIAGGGAGGLELATRLGKSLGARGRARIVLVDRSPTHFWKPLLHAVASGKLDPQAHQVEYSAQAAEHGFQFVCGEVTSVDRHQRLLNIGPYCTAEGNEILPQRLLGYDKLVLAFGAVTNFFNLPGAAEHALSLDSVSDAENFRRRLIACCMKAGSKKTCRINAPAGSEGALLNIVIVGGGATGVELAAELKHTVRTLSKYNVHALHPDRDVRIRIIERGPLLLPHLDPRLGANATRHLGKLGVEVCTNTVVARVEADGIVDSAAVRYPSDITLWAAGVVGPAVCRTLGVKLNRLGQIEVTQSLQTPEDPHVFAIGDCSSYVCPDSGAAAPPRAQVAHQQAMFLSRILSRPADAAVPVFHYRDYGSLVSLGPLAAVGSLNSGGSGRELLVGGKTARLLYSLLYQKHILSLHGFVRMAAHMLAHWIRTKVLPAVKLH